MRRPRRPGVGAPLIASVLLALSAVAVFHAPPIGPIGLLLLAGAVVLLARGAGLRAGDREAGTLTR